MKLTKEQITEKREVGRPSRQVRSTERVSSVGRDDKVGQTEFVRSVDGPVIVPFKAVKP